MAKEGEDFPMLPSSRILPERATGGGAVGRDRLGVGGCHNDSIIDGGSE